MQLEAEKPFPHDRGAPSPDLRGGSNSVNPQWAKKGLFAMLMLDEGLARVTTELDLERSPAHRSPQGAGGDLRPVGRRGRPPGVRGVLLDTAAELPRLPPVLLRSRGGHFMDKPDNVISLSTSPRCEHSKSFGARRSTRCVFAPTFTLTPTGPGRSSNGSAATYGSAA